MESDYQDSTCFRRAACLRRSELCVSVLEPNRGEPANASTDRSLSRPIWSPRESSPSELLRMRMQLAAAARSKSQSDFLEKLDQCIANIDASRKRRRSLALATSKSRRAQGHDGCGKRLVLSGSIQDCFKAASDRPEIKLELVILTTSVELFVENAWLNIAVVLVLFALVLPHGSLQLVVKDLANAEPG